MAIRKFREEEAAAYGRRAALASCRKLLEWANQAPNRRPDDEYIHELRVRLRRARASMRAFRRYYPSRTDFDRRMRPLRRLARALGPMRDADVTASVFTEVLRNTPYPPRAVVSLLTRHHALQEQRWLRVRPALEAVRGLKPSDLAPPPGQKGAGRSLSKHARRQLLTRLDDVWAHRTAWKTRGPTDLHALRIEVKRLRYTVETFDRLLGEAGAQWGERLRELQSVLGLVNDHTVALVVVHRAEAQATAGLERAGLELVERIVEGRRGAHVARAAEVWASIDIKALRRLIRGL